MQLGPPLGAAPAIEIIHQFYPIMIISIMIMIITMMIAIIIMRKRILRGMRML